MPSSHRVLTAAMVSALVLASVSSGCDRGESAPAPAALAAPLDERPHNPTCLAPAPGQGRVRLEPLFGGGQFSLPVDATIRGDRMWVAENDGRMRIMDMRAGGLTMALDLSPEFAGATRFVGVAFHPTKARVYVATDHYVAPFYSEVLAFDTNDDRTRFDPSTRTTILHVDRPTVDHSVGTLRFGADGFLYVGSGDGGTNNGPEFTTYDPTTLLGAILRIDVDGAVPYAIPKDNPFVGTSRRPEIWAGGFRNPFRFAFDRATGQLWAGDVGALHFEEIDVVERGKDYGWPTLEGDACNKPDTNCDASGKTAPIYAYGHTQFGGCVTGGFVYHGKALEGLAGRYLFGDYILGQIWALQSETETSPAGVERLTGVGSRTAVVAFAEDDASELYAVDLAGSVLALRPGNGAPPVIPERLSESGCVDPSDPTKPAAGMLAYGVNAELWSDGARKDRWFAIPDGSTVKVAAEGEWDMPDGAVMMKSFRFGDKLVETRLLMHLSGAEWTAYSYQWNDAQTDAVRVDAPTTVDLPGGGTWNIPSSEQCFRCHTLASWTSLGLDLAQLDRKRPNGDENQIAAFARMGIIDPTTATNRRPTLHALDDTSVDVTTRARSYLHANCSMCHRPNGTAPSAIDFRFERPFAELRGCSPSTSVAGAVAVLAPGDPSRSALFLRVSRRGEYQMPPLGTSIVDPAALEVLGSWIRGLTACE